MRSRLLVAAVVLLTASGCAALHPTGLASGARVASPSPVSASPATNIQLSAPSVAVVWALVDYHDLYRSFDQGLTWERHGVPDSLGVRPVVSFIDDRQGWLLAPGSPTTQCQEAPAAVWRTSDAGATWQRLAAGGIASAQCKNGIWFDDAEHGLISAWDDMHAATIYRTSDGGATWRATSLRPNPPNYQSDTGGAGWKVVWMRSFGTDAYLAANGTPYIFKSTDGGATWAWVTKTPTPAIVLVSEFRWLDFSAPGQTMESVNGGQAFQPFASDFHAGDTSGARFVFADANTGYAVTDGVLQRTTDGGARWTRLAPPGVFVEPSPAPTALPPGCVSLASGARIATWVTYSDPTYGFAISYPSAYTFERAGRGNPDIGWLAVYRAVDTCYLGGYPPGQVEVNVLIKPDAATLTAFVHKHAVGACEGSGGLFWGVSNPRSTTVLTGDGVRDAVTFDETGACTDGPSFVHNTLVILRTGYVLQTDWWASDPRIATSVQTTFDKMLMTLKG